MRKVIATKDKSFVRKWYVTVDEDVPDILREDVEDVVTAVLTDLTPGSWSSYGYEFQMVLPSLGMRYRRSRDNWKDTFWIRVSTPKTIRSRCSFDKLSCADLTTNVIYLNADRWRYGSPKVTEVPLEVYRAHVCAHEIGHLLHHYHRTCGGCNGTQCEGDVMQEFTRIGWRGCKPSLYALYD